MNFDFAQNIIILILGELCMKAKYLIFAMAFALLYVGCSEKKEEPQSQQQVEQPVSQKKSVVPLDSSQILRYKDIDQSDSIMVGIRAFHAAEKEFVKRWNYTKDTKLFMDAVGKICREARPCASMQDSIAYKKDVTLILDSLMRNDLLDGAIEARIQEMNGPCFGDNYNKNKKKCDEESEDRVRRKVIEELKRRKGK